MTKDEAIEKIKNGDWQKSKNNNKGNVESICEIVNQIDEPNKWHKTSESLPEINEMVVAVEKHKKTGKIYTGFGVRKDENLWNVALCTADFPSGEIKEDFEIIAWHKIESYTGELPKYLADSDKK